MARAYYGSRISDNMTRTSEGYLICHNVPIARTGWQEYLGREIGGDLEPDKAYQVYRDPSEVFSEATVASFEGKTVTDGHVTGSGLIDPTSEGAFHRGHAQNVRRGSGADEDLLVADLFIKDAGLISKIENNVMREVSAGYQMQYVPFDDDADKFRQIDIRANHIAVVLSGRAGDRVAIKDEKPLSERRKKEMTLKDLFTGWFKSQGADAKPEDISAALALVSTEDKQSTKALDEAISTALGPIKSEIGELKNTISELVKSDKEVHKKFGADAAMAGLDSLEEELEEKKKEKADDEDPDDDEGKKKEDKADDCSTKDEGVMGVVPVPELSGEDLPQNPIPGADSAAAIKAAIRTMRPIIAAIPDPVARKQAADSLAAELKKMRPARDAKHGGAYAAIAKAAAKSAQDAANKRDDKNAAYGDDIKKKFHKKSVAR
jgi:hypothetical protein